MEPSPLRNQAYPFANICFMPRSAWRVRSSFSISEKRAWLSPWQVPRDAGNGTGTPDADFSGHGAEGKSRSFTPLTPRSKSERGAPSRSAQDDKFITLASDYAHPRIRYLGIRSLRAPSMLVYLANR